MKKILAVILVFIIAFCSGCVESGGIQSESDESIQTDMNTYLVRENNNSYEILKKNDELLLPLDLSCDIKVCDDWLYFVEDGKSIHKIHKDGRNHSLVIDCSSYVEHPEECINYVHILDEKIVFRMGGFRLYVYDFDKGIEEVYFDTRCVGFHKGEIYVLGREGTIYKYDISKRKLDAFLASEHESESKEQRKNIYKNFVIGENGTIFYYKNSPDGLYSFEKGQHFLVDNSKNVKIYSLCIFEENLYYVSEQNDGFLLMEYKTKEQKVEPRVYLPNYNGGLSIDTAYISYNDINGDTVRVSKSGCDFSS